MKIFYIDTSSNYLYAGIVFNDRLLASSKINFNRDLSKYTLNEIAKLFKEANLKPNDIDKIIVVAGPGSFTGIRIGMTFAKIFAWSLNKKITTISSLDAMSVSVTASDKFIVPIIDARRGYVYAGIYHENQIVLENQYIKLDDLVLYLEKLNKEYIFVTNQSNFKFSNQVNYDPDILEIVKKYQNKKSISAHLVEPEYLKLTEAEENLGTGNHDN